MEAILFICREKNYIKSSGEMEIPWIRNARMIAEILESILGNPDLHSHLSTAVAWREKKYKHFVFHKYFSLVLGVLKSKKS